MVADIAANELAVVPFSVIWAIQRPVSKYFPLIYWPVVEALLGLAAPAGTNGIDVYMAGVDPNWDPTLTPFVDRPQPTVDLDANFVGARPGLTQHTRVSFFAVV